MFGNYQYMTSNHLLLYRLAELMLEHEQHILTVDFLFDDEQIGDFVKSIQIDSPYQQMLYEGVLTESVREEKLFVSFTVEGYFHYVLGEVIYNQTKGKSPKSLKQIVEENKLNGAKEGVEQCLIRDVQKRDLKRLMWMIDEGGKILDICSIPLASAFLVIKGTAKSEEEKLQLQHKQVKVVFKQLFEEATDNDISVLDNTIDFLESAQQNKIVEIIYLYINETVKPNNLKKAIIYLKSIQYVLKDKREEKLNIILQKEFEADDSELLILFYNEIALQFDFISKYDKAIEYYDNTLAIELKVYRQYHPSIATSYNNLGLVYYRKGDYDKAIGYHEKSLAIRLKIHGEQHTSIGNSYNNLGLGYYGKGEYKKAIEYYEKTLAIDLKVHGDQHSSTGITYNNLGCAFLEIGENDKAIEYHEKSLAIRLKVHGVEHPSTGESYDNLGSAFWEKDEYDKSIDYHEKSLAIRLKVHGEEHPSTGYSYNNLGCVFLEIGKNDKAIEYHEKSLVIRLKVHGEEHPSIGDSYNNLGWTFEKIGQYDKAIEYHEKSLVTRLKVHGEEHPFTGTSYNNLGSVWNDKGEYNKALDYYDKCLKIQLKTLGNEHPDVASSYNDIGTLYLNLDEFNKAIVNFQKGLKILHKGGFPFKIAQCYEALNKPSEALEYYIQSAEIRKEDIGIEDEATQDAISNAKCLAKELNKENELPEWMR